MAKDDTIGLMSAPSTALPDARELLRVARKDRDAASASIASLDTDSLVALVCSAPVRDRAPLLALVAEPEAVIPELPEAEFCFTVKAVGLETATWLLESASPEQIVASIDLDAWHGQEPQPAQLDAWLAALAETSDEVLMDAIRQIDDELLVQWLRERVFVAQKPNQSDDDWFPPEKSQTLDGQFYFVALRDDDDIASIVRALHVIWNGEYWTYFRLMQGVIHELPSDNTEWALRWREARLQDLGFPAWAEAMGLYRFMDERDRTAVPASPPPLELSGWALPIWMPQLPEPTEGSFAVFRAIARLDDAERSAAFYAFIAVANGIAVADRMPLSDTETTPQAIAKAARFIDGGLETLATANDLDHTEVLRRVPLAHLFRVGANLEPDEARPRFPSDDDPA